MTRRAKTGEVNRGATRAGGRRGLRLPPSAHSPSQSVAEAAIEAFVRLLFTRAIQLAIGMVLLALVIEAAARSASPDRFAVGCVLLAVAGAALLERDRLIGALRRWPRIALLFPLPPLAAITLDGGAGSIWTPLVAIAVVMPALLGHPWMALACALLASSGQAMAAVAAADTVATQRLVELALFNAIGTIAAGLGVALSVAALARSIRTAPIDLERLRDGHPVLSSPSTPLLSAGQDASPGKPQLLSPAEHRVVELLAQGCAPKQIAHDLGIALSTVRTHLKRSKRKVGARTLSELVGAFVTEETAL